MYTQVDVSAVLKPGVYLLWQGTAVVYVGRGTCPLVRVYTHKFLRRQQIAGRKVTMRTRMRPIAFDKVTIIPALESDLDRIERELIGKYQPKYNIMLKDPSIQVTIEDLIGHRLKPTRPKPNLGLRV